MGLFTQLPEDLGDVDVIIAGGGTAGCIVATRLSQADPELSILVIEGGQNNHNSPSIVHPLLFLNGLLPTSTNTLFYKGNVEPQLADRELVVPSGGVLGGGSSINLMMYTRAQRHDWDSWKMPGWSADEMLPFLKKLETYRGPGSKTVHGDNGPIQISEGTYVTTRLQDQFIGAANKLGYPELKDLQDLDSNNGVQRALRYIGTDGRRQDTAHQYLHPILQDGAHPNLHVLVENQVVRIVFEGQRAVGVEFRSNPAFQDSPVTRRVLAKKLVLASCGALGSPLLLERSGVGHKAVLEKSKIPIVAEVPGVGQNYQDHHLLVMPYYSALEPKETFDAVMAGRENMTELIETDAAILGWNGQDVACKLRPSESDVCALGPEFQEAYKKDFEGIPNKPLTLMAALSGFPGDPSSLSPGQYFATSAFTVYPYSRGHIHITDSDPAAKIDFETGFLKHPMDVKKIIWAYKKQREIVRRMEIYRGEFAAGHPPFAETSAAASVKLDGPPPASEVPEIVYTDEDDAVIEKWARENVGTTWHSLGTCKMGRLEDGGVVSANLDVHGVEGLKVADLSIPPQNVGANTANTAMAIGEKAASIIIKELGLEK